MRLEMEKVKDPIGKSKLVSTQFGKQKMWLVVTNSQSVQTLHQHRFLPKDYNYTYWNINNAYRKVCKKRITIEVNV